MRLFISIDLDENLKKSVRDVINQIKKSNADVKFIEPENLHFTLKFLGDVNENMIHEIERNMMHVIDKFRKFKINIHGSGYFGSPNFIKVIWLDVKEGEDKLIELMKQFNKSLDNIRHEKYKPAVHLTLGRVRSGKNSQALLREIEKLKIVNIGEMCVESVKLKKSELTREGPKYTDLKVFTLKE